MKWRLLIVVWLVSLLIVGCAAEPQEEATPTPIPTSVVPEKPVYEVQRGTVERKIQFTARVSPLQEKDLFFKMSGYVSVVYVEKGDWVEEGTVLAELEVEDLLNQLALAQLDLESAQEAYSAAEESHRRQLFSAEMNLAFKELALERAKIQKPLVDLTSLKLAVERAAEYLEEAQIAYKEALDRPWEPQVVRDSLLKNITEAERNYAEVQARYQFAVLQANQSQQLYAVDLQILELEIQMAEKELEWLQEGVDPVLAQQVESAQLRVERIQTQLEAAQLIAPFSGEVTSLSATPGNAVEARKPVAVLADPNEVDIAADLISTQMDDLEEGMPVQITLSSAPGQVFTGLIQTLPYPFGTGGGSVKVEDMDQRTHITLDDPDAVELEVGDLVKVTVMIERSEDTLYLPPAAIRTFEGRRFVMVVAGDRRQKVDVRLGIEGEDRVEILDGLEEGQIVEGQ